MKIKHQLALLITLSACLLTPGASQAFPSDAEKIKKHLEAIKARGEPTTRQEVEQKRNALQPGVEDVSSIWLEGMKPMQLIEFFEREPPIPPYFKLLNKKKPPLPSEEWTDLPDVERFLKEFEPSIRKFHEAARRGGYGRVENTRVWHDESLGSDELFGTINATNILAIDVVVQSRRGEVAGCTSSLSAILRLSRDLKNEPGILGFVAPAFADEESTKALAYTLCVTDFTAPDLAAARKCILSRREHFNLEQIYLEERIICIDALTNPVVSPYSPPIPAISESDWNAFFEISQQMIENARKPFPDAMIAEESLVADLEKQIEDKSTSESMTRVLRLLRGRGYWNWFASFARHQLLESAADAGIACELYRRDHGDLPLTLEALVPKFLSSVPTDPFSGKPMLYKQEESGFTIYSVGRNKTDDGGKLDSKTGDEGLFFPTKTK